MREYAVKKRKPLPAFNNFVDVVYYARASNMCMSLGCTTCGSMEYRQLLRNEIGRDRLEELIRAVKKKDLEWMLRDHLYEPFRVLLVEFPEMAELDCPLANRYRIMRNHCIAAKSERQAKAAALQ